MRDGLNPGSVFSQTTKVQRGRRAQIKAFQFSLMSVMDKLSSLGLNFVKPHHSGFGFAKTKTTWGWFGCHSFLSESLHLGEGMGFIKGSVCAPSPALTALL